MYRNERIHNYIEFAQKDDSERNIFVDVSPWVRRILIEEYALEMYQVELALRSISTEKDLTIRS
jgi:hypothetical protein